MSRLIFLIILLLGAQSAKTQQIGLEKHRLYGTNNFDLQVFISFYDDFAVAEFVNSQKYPRLYLSDTLQQTFEVWDGVFSSIRKEKNRYSLSFINEESAVYQQKKIRLRRNPRISYTDFDEMRRYAVANELISHLKETGQSWDSVIDRIRDLRKSDLNFTNYLNEIRTLKKEVSTTK